MRQRNVWRKSVAGWYLPASLVAGALLVLTSIAAAETGPAPADGAAERAAQMPHLELNREERYIDLEGEICLTEGMLELGLTVVHGKEHESIAAIFARPQHVHLALLLLDLEPGQPGRWEYEDNRPRPIPPEGDPVRISLLIENEAGEVEERPLREFIRRAGTDELLPDDVFLFAGSHIADPPNADPYYVADMTGEVAALVSFDSELLAWPQPASHSDDQLIWKVNEETIPELGTPVTVRLRPVDDWEGPAELPDHTEVEPPEDPEAPLPGEGGG